MGRHCEYRAQKSYVMLFWWDTFTSKREIAGCFMEFMRGRPE